MALNSNSTVGEILADERGRAIMAEYTDVFYPENHQLDSLKGMKLKMAMRFPGSGISKADQKTILARLDALDTE